MADKVTIQDIQKLFEIEPEHIQKIMQPFPGPKEAQAAIDEFKIILKSKYRKAVFKYHPDHGGDADTFKKLSVLYTNMMKSLRVIVPRPKVQVVRFYSANSSYTYSSTTSSGVWRYS